MYSGCKYIVFLRSKIRRLKIMDLRKGAGEGLCRNLNAAEDR